MSNTIYTEFYNNILNNIKNENIDTSTAFKIVQLSIDNMNKYKNLPGNEKKDHVISLIKDLIKNNDNVLDENLINILNNLLDNNIINEYIDNICSLIKKKNCSCLNF